MDVTQDTFISPTVRRLTLSFSGPDHCTINMSPGKDFNMIKWSLTENVPPPTGYIQNNRPNYFIFHSRGIEFKKLDVTIDFEWKKYPGNTTRGKDEVLVDINFASFYLFGDNMRSEDMKGLVRKMPSWTYPLGWSAVTQMYSIPA